ncbi:hypothetical protein [Terricaulis sp.]|uniref:hypothetical protein n=1 Tax=Terricaulis sp. TaxID=2768686 RepID=UPI00378356AC
MIWILLAGLSGTVVVAVAAWARASRRRVEAAEKLRRERHRLDLDEEALLARLKREKEGGG